MTLAALLAEVEVATVSGPTDAEVTAMSADSRRVVPGTLFFGIPGARSDGAAYAEQALAAGAIAAVVARGTRVQGGTVIEVEEPRRAMAQAAARFHGHPEQALDVVAVTGTNGKTTTTWMLESIFRAAGWRAGVIGTTGVRLGDESRSGSLTTPDSPELFGLLREMAGRQVRAVAIEVSSHALVQRRAFGLAPRAAVFTNLTHDHLDYHGTMERYLDAKLMLFDGRNGARPAAGWTAVVNADDPSAPAVAAAARAGGGDVVTFGVARDAHVRIHDPAPSGRGLRITLRYAQGESALVLPLLGRHNAWNAAGAFAAARALELAPATIVAGLESMPAVPGRLERVDEGQPFLVAVDYAHTPDALERALGAAREHAGGRVLLVFGCGGDRDRGKRPAMGKVAARAADRAWVTNDNPRGEDPAAIAADIMAGVPAGTKLEVILDRREAIGAALAVAREGDVVLVAGKGHETTQTIGDHVLPFDDRAVAREWLRARSAGPAPPVAPPAAPGGRA